MEAVAHLTRAKGNGRLTALALVQGDPQPLLTAIDLAEFGEQRGSILAPDHPGAVAGPQDREAERPAESFNEVGRSCARHFGLGDHWGPTHGFGLILERRSERASITVKGSVEYPMLGQPGLHEQTGTRSAIADLASGQCEQGHRIGFGRLPDSGQMLIEVEECNRPEPPIARLLYSQQCLGSDHYPGTGAVNT